MLHIIRQLLKNGLGKSQTENLGKIWHKKLENLYLINSPLILSSPKAHQWGHFSFRSLSAIVA